MNIFLRFNRNKIHDRQIDTLIGLAKGLIADGKIVHSEAEFLNNWLIQSRQASDHPILANLLEKVSAMLKDGILDAKESKELFQLLQKVTGEPSDFGEVAKSSNLPLCEPPPSVVFPGNSFLFTGTCAYGTRKQCQEATKALGGICAQNVTKKLDYVVLGAYVTDSWAHESFGRKIETAMQYRGEGTPLSIISEEHWANSGNLSV